MTAIESARAEYESAHAASDRVTPGGLHGDPATLSGVRRKPNRKADVRRHAAYDRQAKAGIALMKAERDEEIARRIQAREQVDITAHCDIVSLKPGDKIRTRHGWHRVVRVSAKSVSVKTGYSWTDRVPFDKIIETRSA